MSHAPDENRPYKPNINIPTLSSITQHVPDTHMNNSIAIPHVPTSTYAHSHTSTPASPQRAINQNNNDYPACLSHIPTSFAHFPPLPHQPNSLSEPISTTPTNSFIQNLDIQYLSLGSTEPFPSHISVHDSTSLQDNLFVDLQGSSIQSSPIPATSNEHSMFTQKKLQQNPHLASQMAPHIWTTELRSVKTALCDLSWLQVMDEEISILHDNNTWVIVPRPSHTNVVGSKWVYQIKYKEDGSIDRLKVRLLARGYTQFEWENFDKTFSSVIWHTTILIIIYIVVTNARTIHQLHNINVFIHGHPKETVNIKKPLGFESSTQPNYVYLLKRSSYGLKQGLRAWFDCLSQFLLSLEFFCSKVNPSLFISHEKQTIIFMSYVWWWFSSYKKQSSSCHWAYYQTRPLSLLSKT